VPAALLELETLALEEAVLAALLEALLEALVPGDCISEPLGVAVAGAAEPAAVAVEAGEPESGAGEAGAAEPLAVVVEADEPEGGAGEALGDTPPAAATPCTSTLSTRSVPALPMAAPATLTKADVPGANTDTMRQHTAALSASAVSAATKGASATVVVAPAAVQLGLVAVLSANSNHGPVALVR